jgi:DNA-directed RNA polymerase delta subunit
MRVEKQLSDFNTVNHKSIVKRGKKIAESRSKIAGNFYGIFSKINKKLKKKDEEFKENISDEYVSLRIIRCC